MRFESTAADQAARATSIAIIRMKAIEAFRRHGLEVRRIDATTLGADSGVRFPLENLLAECHEMGRPLWDEVIDVHTRYMVEATRETDPSELSDEESSPRGANESSHRPCWPRWTSTRTHDRSSTGSPTRRDVHWACPIRAARCCWPIDISPTATSTPRGSEVGTTRLQCLSIDTRRWSRTTSASRFGAATRYSSHPRWPTCRD